MSTHKSAPGTSATKLYQGFVEAMERFASAESLGLYVMPCIEDAMREARWSEEQKHAFMRGLRHNVAEATRRHATDRARRHAAE